MTDHDRGAYTPQTDAPLAFDARAPRGSRRPLPMALIGSGVVLLVLIVAVVMFYRGGVRGGAPVAVGEPVGPVKTAPAETAQNDDPFAHRDVYAAQNVPATPTPAAPAFAPPPEEPKPRPAAEAGLKVQTIEPSTVKPVPAAPAATAAAPPARLAPAPAPATAVAAASVKPVAPAVAAPPVRTATAPPAPPAPAATTPAAPSAAAGASVQIGAYSSASLADKGFGEVSAAFPGYTVGKAKRVEPLAREGKTLYRTSVTGFANRTAAQAFCDALKAAGRVCLVKG